jgi:iron complex transport system substrate-binding protein
MDVEDIARIAVDCGLKLHRDLGPGLLETVYEKLMATSLARRGISVERQRAIPIEYEGERLPDGFRADLLLEGQLIIEIKCVDRLAPVHSRQLLTYLRLAKLPLGLLMNFGGETFREGLKRIINSHGPFAPSRLCVNREPAGEAAQTGK